MQVLFQKIKENVLSVLPIVLLVLVLNFTLLNLEKNIIISFLIGAVLIVLGLSIFLLGIETGINKIGKLFGNVIAKSNSLLLLLGIGVLIGVAVTIAEPSLSILAGQASNISLGKISFLSTIIVVSLGTGILLSLGIVRIVYAIKLHYVLIFFYLLVLLFSLFSNADFLGLAFDASGATTGALAVPFILSIAVGTSKLESKRKKNENDGFGLVGIASIGAILAVLIMGILKNTSIEGELEISQVANKSLLRLFVGGFFPQALEVLLSLLPILVLFFIFNIISFKLKKHDFIKVIIGLLLSTFGLTLFLLGVNQGFMQVASLISSKLVLAEKNTLMLVIAFVLGISTILAEPAVHILTREIEYATNAYVKSSLVMFTLCMGVGIAVFLAVLKTLIPALQLWHILLPGYALALILTFFCPSLFVGIAFDSGGVASGPMTATFILAFIQGAAQQRVGADVVLDGFGVISLVAMAPLISLQLLGLLYKFKTNKKSRGNYDRKTKS